MLATGLELELAAESANEVDVLLDLLSLALGLLLSRDLQGSTFSPTQPTTS